MNIKSQFLDQQKFSRQHEHTLFFKNGTKCVNVSHTPKLELHIVPNVYIAWKDLTWEMEYCLD
jgi:hypothetical protein